MDIRNDNINEVDMMSKPAIAPRTVANPPHVLYPVAIRGQFVAQRAPQTKHHWLGIHGSKNAQSVSILGHNVKGSDIFQYLVKFDDQCEYYANPWEIVAAIALEGDENGVTEE
jgi:hypothetical protein|tara:strand:+ start:2926 stop:3264 length:339 start_codon:yes stop_codon:yes gene_type:complete